MSTLVLVMAAGMAIPGDVPREAMEEIEQGLDLRGQWEGRLGIEPGSTPVASYKDGRLTVIRPDGPCSVAMKVIDEGGGKCRCRLAGQEVLGIYQWQGEQLVLCIGRHEKRPATFQIEDGLLLILHRVKPSK